MKWCTRIVLAGTLLAVAGGMAPAKKGQKKPAKADAALGAIRQEYTQLHQQIQAHPAFQHDAYLHLGMHLVRRFMHQLQAPIPSVNCPSAQWKSLQLGELGYVLKRTKARLAALKTARARPYVLAKPQPPIVPKGGMLWDTGGAHKRPVFLYGYGHFGQVAADLPNFHALGVSLVQQVRGPNSLSPDGKFSKAKERHIYGNSIVSELKTAHRSGVMMDLLLTPSYFPAWARKKDPQVTIHRRPWNFITYKIDNPTARSVIHTWLHTIIPMVRNQPALFSVNLANEPAYFMSGLTAQSRPEWIRYLKKKHGSIAALNALYHSHYKSFAQVPPPAHVRLPGATYNARLYDWCRFNQHHFAAWFRWMNGQVKKLAPHLLTSAKITWTFGDRTYATINGIAPEMICDITSLAGNDCWAFDSPKGPWAFGWSGQEMWYDLLNSFRNQPVFNSENHVQPDNAPPTLIRPAQTRAALWQGALHHLAATTIWVWDPGATPGSIGYRPANIYAADRAMLDANRLAPELVKVNQAPAHVALLYTFPSIFWSGKPHQRWGTPYFADMTRIYAALSLTGHKVTFISGHQLTHDQRSPANAQVKWLVLAGSTNVTNATLKGLQRFVAHGGHLIAIGKKTLAFDQYNRPRKLPKDLSHLPQISLRLPGAKIVSNLDAWLDRTGLKTPRLKNAKGQPAWGVEYRIVKTRRGLLIPMMNMKNHAKTVRLNVSGPCRDLISGRKINPKSIHLSPMQPLLLLAPAKHS